MKRRSFIRMSSTFTIGGLILPSFSACKKELFEDVNFEGKVLIIGAGVAGLHAANVLKERGIAFEILEASAVHGGRLRKNTTFADFTLDVGGQWIHGGNSVLADLAQTTNTPIFKDNSDEIYWVNGALKPELPPEVVEINEKFEDGDNLPDVSLLAFAHQEGVTNYDNLIEIVANDQGTSADRIGARTTADDSENYSSGGTDYKMTNSMFDLIDEHLAQPVMDQIRFNTVVSEIDYSGDQIMVKDENGMTYTADKVLLTVPITVLKDEDIRFIPALPGNKIAAFNGIGMDAAMKVYLKFSEAFYSDNIGGGLVAPQYANESYKRETNENILFAFVLGREAEELSAMGEEAVPALLAELDEMYDGKASATFLDSFIMDWNKEPYIRGGYSYSRPSNSGARGVAALPVDDKLFFAGEAMNTNGHYQTIHGAMETGYEQVIKILESVEE